LSLWEAYRVFFLLLYVPPGFLREGHVTQNLSSLPGLASYFLNQLDDPSFIVLTETKFRR
jgi:hypothetical protein